MEKVGINKFRSMGITIRPRNGIVKNGSLEKAIIKYCNKFPYHSYVFEKEHEARHVHIQLFFEEGKYKGDVKKQFMRMCETHIHNLDLNIISPINILHVYRLGYLLSLYSGCSS